MKKNPLPHIPKALVDEVIEALDRAITEFGAESVEEHLKHRANRSTLQRHISDRGITGRISIDSLTLLERSLEKFRKYRRGGERDYISSGVESLIAKMHSQHRERKRHDFAGNYFNRSERDAKIIEWAKKANYGASSDKAGIVSEISNRLAADGWSLSESQIRRILRDASITRKNKLRI